MFTLSSFLYHTQSDSEWNGTGTAQTQDCRGDKSCTVSGGRAHEIRRLSVQACPGSLIGEAHDEHGEVIPL